MLDALKAALTRRGLIIGAGASVAAVSALPSVLQPRQDDLFAAVSRLMKDGTSFTTTRGKFTFTGMEFDWGSYRGVAIRFGDVRHAVKVPQTMITKLGPTEAAADAITALVDWVRDRS